MKRRNRSSSSAHPLGPGRDSLNTARSFGPRDWLFVVALLAAVILVYQPALHGGLLWDDNAHITHAELRSWHGLCRIWFDVGATQQYYPLSETAFWVQHKLWGDAMMGYHLVNIALHALTAVMVALVLRQLAIPGAFLAAAIFALHPVHVESVAWITEQKNTLSAVFYLGAAMAYFRFDRNRGMAWYLGALGLFVLALASKIVTVTLPAALLVIFWWQRGKLSWRRDVLPLVPFFAIGVVAGVFVAWVERNLVGAQGPDFVLTVMQRCLLPGRVIWFYLGKLLWPADLHFIYPRWEVSPAVWWQYAFPLALLMLLAVLWKLSRRWRGPLAGLLFFAGTLFPVWGFLNVYWFMFSYVADHFQYLASLGIISLVSGGAALLLERWALWGRPAAYAACLAVLAILADLTWQQSRMYADVETLYRRTIAENPGCWMAYNNLGLVLAEHGRMDEAIACYHKSLDIKPDRAYTHNNLANALCDCGRVDEAIAQYRAALKIMPEYAGARNNLGLLLRQQGHIAEAIEQYKKALEISPDLVAARNNLGFVLCRQGHVAEAIAQYRTALEIMPDYADARYNLGIVLYEHGRMREALAEWRELLRWQPRNVLALNRLAWALATSSEASVRDGAAAVPLALQAVKLTGGRQAAMLDTLAAAHAETGQFAEAVRIAEQALALASSQKNTALADGLRARIKLYQSGSAYHETQQPFTP